MVQRIGIPQIQTGRKLQPDGGGEDAFIRQITPTVRPQEPLDFSILAKAASGKQEATQALRAIAEQEAAEEILSGDEYDGFIEAFTQTIRQKTSGVTDLSKRAEITNREWVKAIEAGNLPEGSGPRTLKTLFAHQAQISAQNLEPSLMAVIEQASRGVDEAGNPITPEDAQAMVDEVLAEGRNIPAVNATFTGSEVYRQISEQMAAKAISQITVGISEAQKEAKFAAWGQVLRRGDETSETPFPGFPGVWRDTEWDDEKQQAVTDYLEESSATFDHAKHRFVRNAEDWLVEALETFAKDGENDEADILQLEGFVERIGAAKVRGVPLDDDTSIRGQFTQSTSAVLSNMRIRLARATELAGTTEARVEQENSVAISRIRTEVVRMVRDGVRNKESIFEALVASQDDTGILEPLGDRIPGMNFANRVQNLVGDILREEERISEIDAKVDIKELDRLKRSGKSFDELEAYAEGLGIHLTPEYANWYSRNRGLALVDEFEETNATLIRARNEYTQQLPQGLFSMGVSEEFRKQAQEAYALDREEFAKVLEDTPGLGPAQAEEELEKLVESSETRKERVVALNAAIAQRGQEARMLVQEITTAQSAKDLPTLERLQESARGLLDEGRVEALAGAVASLRGTNRASVTPRVEVVQSQITTMLRMGLMRAAGDDEEAAADVEGQLASIAPLLREESARIATEALNMPPAQQAGFQSTAIETLLPDLANTLGVPEVTTEIARATDPVVREAIKYSEHRDKSGAWLSGNKSYIDVLPNFPLGEPESAVAWGDFHADGGGDPEKFGELMAETAKDLFPAQPGVRDELALQLFSHGLIPLRSVGGTFRAGAAYGSEESYGSLEVLGFSRDALRALELPPSDPDYKEAKAALMAEAEDRNMDVWIYAPAEEGRFLPFFSDNAKVLLRTHVDFSKVRPSDWAPMVTRFFYTTEELEAATDEDIKGAFKSFGWPTDGVNYSRRKREFLNRQRQIINFWDAE